MTFEHFPVAPTTFKTIPEEQCHLRPKAQGKTTINRRLVAGAALAFVLGACLATAGTIGASTTSIQPTASLASDGYSPAVDSPQGAVAGPKGTGRANGQDYYGVDVDEGCKPETALACGTIECKA